MKLSKSHIFVMCLVVFVSGCAEEKLNQEQVTVQKTSATADAKDKDHMSDNKQASEVEGMKKRDPNALDNRDPNAGIKVTTVDSNTSKSLREIIKEKGVAQKEDCEDQFKNDQGVCEVPNQPYPFPEKGVKPEE